jgi:hypothetical protein
MAMLLCNFETGVMEEPPPDFYNSLVQRLRKQMSAKQLDVLQQAHLLCSKHVQQAHLKMQELQAVARQLASASASPADKEAVALADVQTKVLLDLTSTRHILSAATTLNQFVVIQQLNWRQLLTLLVYAWPYYPRFTSFGTILYELLQVEVQTAGAAGSGRS